MTELHGSMRANGALTGRLGGSSGGGAVPYKIGAGLKVVENELMVDTADAVEEDNTLPITSAAVYTTVGNIEILLGTI